MDFVDCMQEIRISFEDSKALWQGMGIVLPTHISTTEIELEIGFMPGSSCLPERRGFFDNIRLGIWHRNYIV